MTTALNSTSGDLAAAAVEGPHWRFLPLVAVPLWILVGNWLVLLAVARQRSLRTLSNSVIASLAFADFLLAVLVVPLGVYQLVSLIIIVVVVIIVIIIIIINNQTEMFNVRSKTSRKLVGAAFTHVLIHVARILSVN